MVLLVSVWSLSSGVPSGVFAYVDSGSSPPVLVVKNTGDRSIVSVDVYVNCLKEYMVCIPYCVVHFKLVEYKRIAVLPQGILKPGDTFVQPVYFHHSCDRYDVDIVKVTYFNNG